AWRQAIADSARGRLVHGINGTRALLDVFYALPVRLGGWSLLRADCRDDGPRWQCQARYERHDAKASNSSFLAAVPPSWTAEFSPLEHVAVRWHADAHGQALSHLALSSTTENERDLLSALQDIKPGFTQIQIGRPAAIPLSTPTDRQGRPLARPAGQTVYVSRPVHISGPLRSASLLLPILAPAAWEKAAMTLGQAEEPGLKSSKLNLSLQGVFYETDDVAAGMPVAGICARSDTSDCTGP
ncbi:MAG: hypothetical protein WBF88_03580, partial [Pusillimonas sp.]